MLDLLGHKGKRMRHMSNEFIRNRIIFLRLHEIHTHTPMYVWTLLEESFLLE